ncbi:hypothetical protein GPX89_09290 [Nocardia sp. ET3-3]|uniref:Uncharacterized protein n=1 Tax=Nocardia terrae TaxID=2675851 RepID=A0A7K1UT34_9NOCA|nr:hypothetical protein [Nocardia terrae]MVU77441.1 hypothetical protein [Nocardia terrae]
MTAEEDKLDKSWRDDEGRWHWTSEDRTRMREQGREWKLASDTLLDALADRLSPDSLESARRFQHGGEYLWVFSGLAAELVNHRIPITPEERDLLASVLYSMEPSRPDDHPAIRDRDQVMVALNVVNARAET